VCINGYGLGFGEDDVWELMVVEWWWSGGGVVEEW
jgi:hypothetical protein